MHLDRTLGGPGVLKEQLRHVLGCVERFNHLTVQVMPSAQHTHAGLMGPMQLMSTAEGRNLMYVEAQGGGRLISKPEQVSDQLDLFGILRAQALNPLEVCGDHRDEGEATVSDGPRLTWFKSSYSGNEGGACVEVATCPHTVHVRDSKVTDGPTFTVAPAAWTAFVASTARS